MSEPKEAYKPNSLRQITQEITSINERIERERARHNDEMRALENQLATKKTTLEQVKSGLNPETISNALSVISVRGSYKLGGEDRASVIKDAIHDIADNNSEGLKRKYFGTKSYDRWHGQRCDCSYGSCPRRGSIIFAVELDKEFRGRGGRDLTDEEVEAALYYLYNIEEIEAARAKAKGEQS